MTGRESKHSSFYPKNDQKRLGEHAVKKIKPITNNLNKPI